MSTFLRDLAIAKFPRFGITYYIQLDGEPEIQGGSVRATLKFWDGKTAPPQHLTDRNVKMPIWKWGDFMDVIEAEIFSEHRHIVAVELCKRRPDDEYGTLRVQIDKQVTFDALQPQPASGPPKPAAVANVPTQSTYVRPTSDGSERGQPGAGGAPATEALASQGSESGLLRAPQGDRASQNRASSDTPTQQATPPPADPGLPPDCPRCGHAAAYFDGKWVHCGEVVQ